ncbi:MAG: branched-chain amino acid ABC transporter permease [Candidatus Caldarchaeum sp.]
MAENIIIPLTIISILNGLLYASVLFLVSSGLNLVYGVMRIVNLAHGNFFALGAYTTVWLLQVYGQTLSAGPIPYIVPPILGGALVALIAAAVEPTLLRPIYARLEEFQLILTFGILLILQDVFLLVFGGVPLAARDPYFKLGSIQIGEVLRFPTYNLVVIAVGLLIAFILWFILYRTKFGIILRATSMDREISLSLGINVKTVFTVTFVIGCFIAGLTGGYLAIKDTATLNLGIEILVLSFIVMVVGGLGSLKGAFIGALIVGYLRVLVTMTFPEFELALLWLVAAGILLVRPQGLFGR